MDNSDSDYMQRQDFAKGQAEYYAAAGDYDRADGYLQSAGLKPRYGSAAQPAQPGLTTYLMGAGVVLLVLWPVVMGLLGLVRNGVYGLAASFPLAFILPSIGTSPLRGLLGITTAAAIVGGLPLLLVRVIGPARAPRFRFVLWVIAVLLTSFVVLLGTISWTTVVRAGAGA